MLVRDRRVRPKRPFLASRFPDRTSLASLQGNRHLTCMAYLHRVMIDCSRNGVLKVESVKTLLRHLALMGSNMLQVTHACSHAEWRIRASPLTRRRYQLYCEDTYTIPGEPFFGAFLRDLDFAGSRLSWCQTALIFGRSDELHLLRVLPRAVHGSRTARN